MIHKYIIPSILIVLLCVFGIQIYYIRQQNRILRAVEADVGSLENKKGYLEQGWWKGIPADRTAMPALTDTYLPLRDYLSYSELNYGLRISLKREKKGQLTIDNIVPVEYYPLKLTVQYDDLAGFMEFFERLLRGFPLEVTNLTWKGGKVEIAGVIWGGKG